jgi:tRNA pseudouridine38-40 synthase
MQADLRTVEGEFIATCQRLGLFSDWRAAGFASAGRTDRGVHAREQVIAFTTDAPDRAITALNARLPPDCWCTGFARIPDQFHPRYDTVSRTYRYFFLPGTLDIPLMKSAAESFLGAHNFSSFARVGDKNPIRNILAISLGADDDFAYLEVTAESFLWHQVRCMASALMNVGSGEISPEVIGQMLADRPARAISPASAEGLILWSVECGLGWAPLGPAKRSAEYLSHLTGHYLLMGQVCRNLK